MTQADTSESIGLIDSSTGLCHGQDQNWVGGFSENSRNLSWSEGDLATWRSLHRERFERLRDQWKQTRGPLSSTTELVTQPPYQEIIGMGEKVVPLILDELRSELDHWFWALKAVTGEDPVPPADRGDLEAMAEAWLNWGRRRGYR